MSKEAPDFIAENFKLPILKTVLHDFEVYGQAPLSGQSVIQYAPKHKATKELTNLLIEMGRVYKSVKR